MFDAAQTEKQYIQIHIPANQIDRYTAQGWEVVEQLPLTNQTIVRKLINPSLTPR